MQRLVAGAAGRAYAGAAEAVMDAAAVWGSGWVAVAGNRVAELARARFLGGDPAGQVVRVVAGAGEGGDVARAAATWLASWGADVVDGPGAAQLVLDGWGAAPDATLLDEVLSAEAPILAIVAPAGLGGAAASWVASATALWRAPAGALDDPEWADATGELWWVDLGVGAPDEARELARAGIVRVR